MNPRAKVYGVTTTISRKMRIALLAAGSVLGTPSVSTSLVNYAGEYLDVVLTAFIVYESVVHSTNIGWYLSWLLVVYLVYSYIPVFYPEWIVTDRGIRALSGVLTAYFGIVFFVMHRGGSEGAIFEGFAEDFSLVLLGMFGGLFLFTLYFWIGRRERLSNSDSELVETIDNLSEGQSELKHKQLDSLNRPTRAFVIFLIEFSSPVVLVVPCILMGWGAGLLNEYQPIPETLLFGGIFVSYVTSYTTRFPDTDSYDIEIQILDTITDAFQNSKGVIVALACVLGLIISSAYFSVGFGFIMYVVVDIFFTPESVGAGELVSSVMGGIKSGEIGFIEILQIAAVLWFGICLALSLPLVGVYGLFYWLRQLKRSPQYVEFWEKYWHGDTQEQPVAQVARPVGLYIPAFLILSPTLIILNLEENMSYHIVDLPSFMPWLAIGIFNVSWSLFVGIAAWSVWRAHRGNPQPLDSETRDVLVALGVMVAMQLLVGLLAVDIRTLIIISMAFLAVLMLSYFPDVYIYVKERDGIIRYLDSVYIFLSFVPIIIAFKIIPSISNTFLVLFIVLFVGLFALMVIPTYLGQQIDV